MSRALFLRNYNKKLENPSLLTRRSFPHGGDKAIEQKSIHKDTFSLWAGRDSNPQGLPHWLLRPTRLPVSPPARKSYKYTTT